MNNLTLYICNKNGSVACVFVQKNLLKFLKKHECI